MNKKLEEAIKRLKILECDCIYFENGKCTYNKNKCQREQDIETALNYIDNSISKEVIAKKKCEIALKICEQGMGDCIISEEIYCDKAIYDFCNELLEGK